MEQHRWEESEKIKEEERRSEKRKCQKKEDAAAWKGRKIAKHCVFPMFCGPGKSKSRLAKAAGASHLGRWEIKNCTPLWRETHFEVKSVKTTGLGNGGSLDPPYPSYLLEYFGNKMFHHSRSLFWKYIFCCYVVHVWNDSQQFCFQKYSSNMRTSYWKIF